MKSVRFLPGGVQNAPRSSWRSLWAFPAPLPSNYTPAPVGSLWGFCALCEPVGAVRNLRSACADLLPVVVPEYKKGDFFKGGGVVPDSHLFYQKCRVRAVSGLSRGRPVTDSRKKPIFFRPGVPALGLIAAGRIQTAPAADLPELSRRYPQEKRPGAVRLPERVKVLCCFWCREILCKDPRQTVGEFLGVLGSCSPHL